MPQTPKFSIRKILPSPQRLGESVFEAIDFHTIKPFSSSSGRSGRLIRENSKGDWKETPMENSVVSFSIFHYILFHCLWFLLFFHFLFSHEEIFTMSHCFFR